MAYRSVRSMEILEHTEGKCFRVNTKNDFIDSKLSTRGCSTQSHLHPTALQKKGSTRQRLDYGWSTVQSQCTINAHWHRPIGLLVPCTIPLDLTWTQFQELVLVII
jgi:hypothetical protein